MARHSVSVPGTIPAPGSTRHRDRQRRGPVVALVVALLVTGGLLSSWNRLPWALGAGGAQPGCSPSIVRVMAAPAIAPTVRRILAEPPGAGSASGCTRVDLTVQSALAVVAGAANLSVDRTPELWVPDSSLLLDRVPQWRLEKVGSLGLSPVVLATSRPVIEELAWDLAPPTWAQAMTSGRPMAVPDPLQHTESLTALAATWDSLGRGAAARRAVAAVRLETGRVAGLGPESGLALGQTGTLLAPLVPVTEQTVIAVNRSVRGSQLAAVYPKDGSPVIDYQVLRVRPGSSDVPGRSDQERAVDGVAVRLTSSEALSVATEDGFRVTADAGITGAGVRPGPVRALPATTPADLAAVSTTLREVARPSRMLALVDASLSMSADVADGISRIDLATLAAKRGADLLPDIASVGLWAFARHMRGSPADYLQIAPIAPLGGAAPSGRTNRENLLRLDVEQFGGLQGGGTALYDSVGAAVKAVQKGWDERSVNSVVVFTDGANDKSGGLSLTDLTRAMTAQARSGRPIPVFGIGIGPDVDLEALRAFCRASGGKAYQVNSAAEIRSALIDGLALRYSGG